MPSPSPSPSREPSSEQRLRARRVAWPWRVAFLAYALALTTGTHWPNLHFGPAVPTSDKIVHFAAFAGLTLLLWKTRWISRLWIIGVIALLWALLDETSQNIPILRRTASPHDMIANTLGVLVMLAFIWAYRPVGVEGGPNRLRLRLHGYVIEEMFARPEAWVRGLIGAAAGGLPLLVYYFAFTRTTETSRLMIMLAVVIAVLATFFLWRNLWQRMLRETLERRPCLACGAVAADSRPPTATMCTGCGAVTPQGQFLWPAEPSLHVRAAISGKPALIGLIVILLAFAAIAVVPIIYANAMGTTVGGWSLPRAARVLGTLPPTLTRVIDLAVLLLLLAAIVRMYRAGLARFYDRSTRCMRCGHDLRGTPTNPQGIGRCGECGAQFIRALPNA